MGKDKGIKVLNRIIAVSFFALIVSLPFSKAMMEVFTTVITVLFFAKKIVFREKFEFNKTYLFLLFFVVANLVSVFFSGEILWSLDSFISKQLSYIVLMAASYDLLMSDLKYEDYIYNGLAVSACLIFFDALSQKIFGLDFLRLHTGEYHNATSSYIGDYCLKASFSNPNNLGGWLALMLPVTAGLLLAGKGIFKEMKKWVKIVWWLIIPGLFYILENTDCRGAWVGLFAAFLLGVIPSVFMIKRKVKVVSAVLLVFFVLCTALFAGPRVSRIESIFGGIQSDSRGFLWKKCGAIIEDNFWTGIGVNRYSKVVRNFYFDGESENNVNDDYPHNSYMQIFAETGIFGITALILFFAVYFISTGRSAILNADSPTLFFLMGIAAFLIHSFVDNNLFVPQLATLFWILLGIVGVVR